MMPTVVILKHGCATNLERNFAQSSSAKSVSPFDSLFKYLFRRALSFNTTNDDL